MRMFYTFNEDGKRRGPYSPEILKQVVEEGQIRPDDLVEDADSGVKSCASEVLGTITQSSGGGSDTSGVLPDSEAPENHLTQAILVTTCCCMPLGVVAIAYATQVDALYRLGFSVEAKTASEKAQKFIEYSLLLGFLTGLLWAVFYFLRVATRGEPY